MASPDLTSIVQLIWLKMNLALFPLLVLSPPVPLPVEVTRFYACTHSPGISLVNNTGPKMSEALRGLC